MGLADPVGESLAVGRARGRAVGELCRVSIARVPVLVYLVAGTSRGSGVAQLGAGAIVIFAACALAAALNDWADCESDRVNGRGDRPLVSGLARGSDVAWVVAGAVVALALATAALPRPSGPLVVALALGLGVMSAMEPVALQRRGVVGLVVLGLCYLVLPMALALGGSALVSMAPLALVGAGVLAHKDVRDLRGDRETGKATVVVRVGERAMARLAFGLAVAGVGALGLTIGCGWWMAGAAVAVAALGFMAVVGHRSTSWMVARVALVAAAVALAVQAGSSTGGVG